MAQLTLSKSIYQIDSNDNYNLITPVGISASTYDESGSILIENLTPYIYQTGIYFNDIKAESYIPGVIYQIKWSIQYTSSSPVKTITNYFKFSLNANFAGQIFIQTFQNPIYIPVS